jgi:hypothetical protein
VQQRSRTLRLCPRGSIAASLIWATWQYSVTQQMIVPAPHLLGANQRTVLQQWLLQQWFTKIRQGVDDVLQMYQNEPDLLPICG